MLACCPAFPSPSRSESVFSACPARGRQIEFGHVMGVYHNAIGGGSLDAPRSLCLRRALHATSISTFSFNNPENKRRERKIASMMSLRHVFSISLSLLGLSLCVRLLSNPAHTNVQPVLPHQASRVLLITAHPDDECMFFGPTLTNLKSSPLAGELNSVPEVFSLCLSVGDADGLGKVRKEELGRSLDVLHIPEDHRWSIDHSCVSSSTGIESCI